MTDKSELLPFKAFIKVVKSLTQDARSSSFDTVTVIREPLIYAKDKAAVKAVLQEHYPQFFPDAKIFEKETKNEAQFFYVQIYPLYDYEIRTLASGNWICSSCGHVHPDAYTSPPRISNNLGLNFKFCKSEEDTCLKDFKNNAVLSGDMLDDQNYVTIGDPIYIYKCTEKSTGKSYIGKTQNAPFFRWWNHLTHSCSPFGVYLRNSPIENWTFEVIKTLPFGTDNSIVLKVESEFIHKFNCIENGFNRVISSKDATRAEESGNLIFEHPPI